MDQTENHKEVEITLSELLYSIAAKWRFILVCMLCFALLLGGWRTFSFYFSRSLSSTGQAYEAAMVSYNKALDEYNYELASYQSNIEILNNDINSLKDSISFMEKYLLNSVLMQISSSSVKTAILSYSVVPKEQDSDYYPTNVPLATLTAMAKGSSLVQYLNEHSLSDMKEQYIYELISVTNDYDGNLLTIKLVHSDETICGEMLQDVESWLENASDSIQKTAGAHLLTPVSIAQSVQVDLSIGETRKVMNNNLKSYRTSLESDQDDLKALEEPIAPVKPSSSSSLSLMTLVKYLILGAVIGLFLSVLVLVFFRLLTNKLHSARDMRAMYGIPELGNLNKRKYGPFLPALDKLIDRIFSQDKPSHSEEEDYQMVLSHLEGILESGQHTAENLSILLVGSADQDSIAKVCECLLKYSKEKTFSCAGNVTADPAALKTAKSADIIILIEKINKSKLAMIEQEIQLLGDLKKPIAGVILL